MSQGREWINRLRYLGRRSPFEGELDEEIRFHIDARVADLEESGLSRGDALAKARREFGPVARMREGSRSAWQFGWLEDLGADFRYALRMFGRSPGFTLTAVLSLALGIGANSTIFTALDAVMGRPLPVAHPDRLVRLSVISPNNHETSNIPTAFVDQLRRAKGIFSDFITVNADGLSFTYDDRAERIIGEVVSPNFFRFLGVQPILGQAFTAQVGEGHWAPEVVLSYRFWKQRFSGDQGVIGRTIHLNTYPFVIVGVSPPSFFDLEQGMDPELRLLRLPPGQQLSQIQIINPTHSIGGVMARRDPSVTPAQAEAAADAQFQEFLRSAPALKTDRAVSRHLRLLPGEKGWPGLLEPFQTPLFVLLGLVAVVLVIACGNVANMLLARATARRRELAVRASIGAGRARLIRQMLAESVLLSLLGGVLSIAVAQWAGPLLFRFVPQGHLSIVLDLHPDGRALLFTSTLAIVTGLAFGLVPALNATRDDLAGTLKSDSAASIGQLRGAAFRKSLVIAQVALSLVLLIEAGLFVRTLANLRPSDYRMRPDRILLFTMKPQQEIYSPERMRAMTVELVRRVSLLPGVEGAALAELGPLASRDGSTTVEAVGHAPVRAGFDQITPGFLNTIGIPFIAGRDFTANDKPGAPLVAIVNQKLARAVFGNGNAIGQTITLPLSRDTRRPFEVVGVVADTHYSDLHAAPPPAVFVAGWQDRLYLPTLHVRIAGSDAAGMIAAVRREFDAVDKGFPVFNIRTLEMRIQDSLARERLVADLSAAFGVVAVMLAAIGLYGVLSYSVGRRTREIGIRMALGSSSGSVVRLIIREALVLVAAGSAAGAVAAVLSARLLARYLFGVSPADPANLAACAAAMAFIAAIAVSIPALRASRIDPLLALRSE